MGADTDDTAFVKILGGVLRHVGDIRCEFLHTAFGLADFESIFVDMD